MRTFDAPLGKWTRIYTVACLLALAGVGAAVLVAGNLQAALALAGVDVLLLLIGLAFAVRGFEVGSGKLVVLRIGRVTEIDLHDLIEVTPAPKILGRSISLWSTRGMFGYIGYFYSSTTGTYRAYVTDWSKTVLLRFRPGKIVVVSPDFPNRFIEAVQETAPVLESREATAPRPIN